MKQWWEDHPEQVKYNSMLQSKPPSDITKQRMSKSRTGKLDTKQTKENKSVAGSLRCAIVSFIHTEHHPSLKWRQCQQIYMTDCELYLYLYNEWLDLDK